MPSNPEVSAIEPLLEVIEDLASLPLQAAAWATCSGPGWMFGHSSTGEESGRFWQMDLAGDAAFDAIWEQARPRCEKLAGAKLRVIRQYANGHTYGLGGAQHADDDRPGTFTLLYYPNPEWRAAWEGETVFYGDDGEVAIVVLPKPNRAAFFDSRIPHNGRAPSRACHALRVTVAYKLEVMPGREGDLPAPPEPRTPVSPQPVTAAPTATPTAAQRTFSRTIDAATIEAGVAPRLAELAKTVRLPGHAPGQIPEKLLRERYGDRAAHDVLRALAVDLIEGALLGERMIPSECTLVAAAPGGDAEIHFIATYLPDMPLGDPACWTFERWLPPVELPMGVDADEAAHLLAQKLRQDLLDKLDTVFRFPVLPSLIEREVAAIIAQAEAVGLTAADIGGAGEGGLSAIAERRLRLGFVMLELADRFQLKADTGATLETLVCDHILSLAQVAERAATCAELAALAQ